MKRDEIYQSVTNTIISHLEKNIQGYRKPWINVDQDNAPARNPSRGDVAYKGINQFILSLMMMQGDFLKNQWMTYKQAASMGGQVKKGSKSTPVTWYSTKYIDKSKKYYGKEAVNSMGADQKAEIGLETIPMLKLYRVFNVSQIEGLDPSYYEVQPSEPLQPLEIDNRAEAIVRGTGATIEEIAGNKASYMLAADTIKIPLREQFRGVTEAWYEVVFHELAHWTGAPKRLNRDLKNEFGSAAYAREELNAELASAMVSATLGFTKQTTNNAAYLQSWLGVLKQDNKAIFKAAAQAQKAADFILDKSGFQPNPPVNENTL